MTQMNTIAEIESAIERLPERQVAELAIWLEEFRQRQMPPAGFDVWLNRARGAAKVGISTDEIMSLTRGDG